VNSLPTKTCRTTPRQVLFGEFVLTSYPGFSPPPSGLIVKPDSTNCGTKTADISNTKYLTNLANFSNEKSRYTVACVTASYKQVGEEKIRIVESMRTVVVIDLSASCGVQQAERI